MKRTLAGALVWILVFTLQSFAMEIFPLEDVRPGMLGKGKTVIRGTQIEDFFVEVISVIPQTPPRPPLVMVRVTGDLIARSGGIASGMSGSPVYIGDKLLGAIGYGYALTDHQVGLVTPAKQMLELLQGLPLAGRFPDVELPAGITPLKTPLMVSGISGRSLAMLEQSLSLYNLQVLPGVAGVVDLDQDLEPGSAFGVQLMRGDFQITAFGTVTHVEDGAFVGFGHPFLHHGDVSFFVTPAVVHYTMPSLDFPFKISSAGPTIGTLLVDKMAGVAGVLDGGPNYMPVEISVLDKHAGVTQHYYIETVFHETLLLPLVITSVYQAIEAALDRLGQGAAYVRVEFATDNLPHPIIRENSFYSDADIASWALYDLVEGLELLLYNRFQPVGLSQVRVFVELDKKRNTATIEQAIPRVSTVYPGQFVDVEVLLRPFRQDVERRILRIPIPQETLPGVLTVSLRSGGSQFYDTRPVIHTSLHPREEEREERHNVTGRESLDLLIERYVKREKNNEIVAEFYPFFEQFLYEAGSGMKEEGASHEYMGGLYGANWEFDFREPIRVRLATRYVIEGMATFDLEVLPLNER